MMPLLVADGLLVGLFIIIDLNIYHYNYHHSCYLDMFNGDRCYDHSKALSYQD